MTPLKRTGIVDYFSSAEIGVDCDCGECREAGVGQYALEARALVKAYRLVWIKGQMPDAWRTKIEQTVPLTDGELTQKH